MYFRLKDSGFIDTRKQSYLSDINEILITAMETVRDKNLLPDLKGELRELQRLYPLDFPHPNPETSQNRKEKEGCFTRKEENSISC